MNESDACPLALGPVQTPVGTQPSKFAMKGVQVKSGSLCCSQRATHLDAVKPSLPMRVCQPLAQAPQLPQIGAV